MSGIGELRFKGNINWSGSGHLESTPYRGDRATFYLRRSEYTGNWLASMSHGGGVQLTIAQGSGETAEEAVENMVAFAHKRVARLREQIEILTDMQLAGINLCSLIRETA